MIGSREVDAALRLALPKIAYEVRPDYLYALKSALDKAEEGSREQQILELLYRNDQIATSEQRPLCQDTGTVWLSLELGSEEVLVGNPFAHADNIIAEAYEHGALRMSVVKDALLDRSNTNTNTPAFYEVHFRPGTGATLHIMLKGGGSDNASKIKMLAPAEGYDGIKRFVLDTVIEKAANACPPLVIGIGVGGSFDTVASLAKHQLLRPIGEPNPNKELALLEKDLLDAVNALNIGAGGMGGKTTALAVHVASAPCHIAALPVAINMGCSALRTASIQLEDILQ
ncbi:MAG: fumarate hydratase [Coriobacteriia bacterium]|nr:fumarate hydratase [Coriobacteriia bacterium]